MKILFFDGYCSLCNGFVNWGMKHDESRAIQFASLQGKHAEKYLGQTSYLTDLETVVYHRDGQIFDRSEAVLHFLVDLGGAYQVARILFLIPTAFRNFIYKLVAKNRYALFAKRDTCRLPTAEERERLLD